MPVTRRRLLLQFIGFGAWGSLPAGLPIARAQVDPATAALALSLGREVLNAFRRGGDIDRQFAAIDVQLAAIQANQEALANALGMMSDQMGRLQQLVASVPAETQGLGLLKDASSLARQSATFVARDTPRTSKSWRDQRAAFRQRVVQLSFDLSVAPPILQYEPSITLATRQALHALQMVLLAEGDLKRLPPATAEEYRICVENLRGVFEAMTADRGGAVNNLAKRITDLEALIAQLLAAATRAPYASLVRHFTPNVAAPQAPGDAQAERSVQLCLLGPVLSAVERHEAVRDFVSETQLAIIGFIIDSKESRSIVKIDNTVRITRLYGGKAIYQVTRAQSGVWSRDSYTRRLRHLQGDSLVGPREQLLSQDPTRKIQGCIEAPDAESGAPSLYGAFDAFLANHAAHAALQSRLISFRDLAIKSIGICESLDAKLKG